MHFASLKASHCREYVELKADAWRRGEPLSERVCHHEMKLADCCGAKSNHMANSRNAGNAYPQDRPSVQERRF